jgi:hypothetical protein
VLIVAFGVHTSSVRLQRLVIDSTGITQSLGKRNSVHFPWGELSAVSLKQSQSGMFLIATPRSGSALLHDNRWAKRLSSLDHPYLVLRLNRLRGEALAMSAALVRFSGERYQLETSGR